VDWYEGRLHMAEVVRHHPHPDEDHDAWLDALVAAASEALEVPEHAVFLKRRERQRGTSQYQRFAAEGRRFIVSEGGHRFHVNLSDYLDTGLFLDHRNTRAAVQREAAGKRVLNLFAYTGAWGSGGASPSRRRHTKREQKTIFMHKNCLLLPFCVPPAARGKLPLDPRYRVALWAYLGHAAAGSLNMEVA
jgi:hypothetical protein